VAIHTGLPCYIIVIERTYLPGCGYMTGITGLGCGNMIWPFTLRNNIIMTALAGTNDLRMVNAGFV